MFKTSHRPISNLHMHTIKHKNAVVTGSQLGPADVLYSGRTRDYKECLNRVVFSSNYSPRSMLRIYGGIEMCIITMRCAKSIFRK